MNKSPAQLVLKWATYQWGDLLFANGHGPRRILSWILGAALLVAAITAQADDTATSTNKLSKTDAVMLAPEIATDDEVTTNDAQLSSKFTDTIAPLMSV